MHADTAADTHADTAGSSHPVVGDDVMTASGTASGTAADTGASGSTATATITLDLEAIEADLADVEIALARLEAGTYWTCEVTGQPLPDDLMAREPTRRRLPTV